MKALEEIGKTARGEAAPERNEVTASEVAPSEAAPEAEQPEESLEEGAEDEEAVSAWEDRRRAADDALQAAFAHWGWAGAEPGSAADMQLGMDFLADVRTDDGFD